MGGGVAQYMRSGMFDRLRKYFATFLPNTRWLSNRLIEMFLVYPVSCTNVILKAVAGRGSALREWESCSKSEVTTSTVAPKAVRRCAMSRNRQLPVPLVAVKFATSTMSIGRAVFDEESGRIVGSSIPTK